MAVALHHPQPEPVKKPRRVFYPVSDGKPMAETDKHRELMVYFIAALMHFLLNRKKAYVSGNNFLFYEEGNSKARLSPDCYVVLGVEQRLRDSFKVWEEDGRLPAVVFEFTSKK